VSLSIRTLASDTAVYGVTTILGRFLTFLLTPFYTHYLSGPAEYGHIATIYTFIAFINIVYSFGLDTAFMRFYVVDNEEQKKHVFNNAFWGIFFLAALFSSFGIMFIHSTGMRLSGLEHSGIILTYAILIPFFDALTVVPYSVLRMERRSKRFALTKFVVIIINVMCNILFVGNLHYGALGVLLSGVISSLAGVILLIPEYIRYVKPYFSSKLLKEMLSFGLPTVPAAFSSVILQLIDRPILGLLTDVRTVGLYQANYRLGIPMMIFVSIFETAWKPFYLTNSTKAEAKETFSRVFTLFIAICSIIFIIIAIFIQDIVTIPFNGKPLINSVYWSGLNIVPIILIGYLFNGMYINMAAGFHISKKTRYLPIAMGGAAVSNIILNFILTPFLGITGAAFSMLGSYIIAASILYVLSQRVYPISYQWSTIFSLLSISVIAYLIHSFFDFILWQKIVLVTISLATTFILLQKKKVLGTLYKK